MASGKSSFIIRMGVEGGKYVKSELREVTADGERSLKRLDRASAGVDLRFGSLSRTILTRFLPALSGAALTGSILNNIQAFEKVDTRLRELTDSSEEYAAAQKFISSQAEALNTDILTLADGYAKLLALQNSDVINQSQLEALVIGLTNAKAALGATDGDLERVLYGLSQGLSAGILRAEELNQVVEPLPGLLQSLDKAAGQGTGGFRELVNDGEVTSDFFLQTLIPALEQYEGAAAKMTDTVTGSFQRLENSWVELSKAIGEGGVVDSLATMTTLLAENIRVMNHAAEGTLSFAEANGILAKSTFATTRFIQSSWFSVSASIWGAGAATLDAVNAVVNGINKIPGVNIAGGDALAEYSAALKASSQDNFQKFGDSLNFGPNEKMAREIAAARAHMEKLRKDAQKIRDGEGAVSTFGSTTSGPSDSGKLTQSMEKEKQKIEQIIAALKMRNEQLVRSREEQDLYNQLQKAGVSLESDHGREIARLVNQYTDLKTALDQSTIAAERLQSRADQIGDAFGNAAERAIVEFDNLGDVIDGVLTDIRRVFVQEFVSDPVRDFAGSAFKSIFGSMFGGARAGGGPVLAGKTYLVGEEGPELFTAGQSGHITPNHMMTSMGATNLNVNVINQSNAHVQVRRSQGNGGRDLDIILTEKMNQAITSGRFDTTMRNRYGATPVTVGR